MWYGSDDDYLYWQNWLNEMPWTTLFVDGNHENHSKLDAMPVEYWNGGKIHRVQSNVIHLMRGQIFTIDGLKFFTMGGASSRDKIHRTENKSWWSRELPDTFEYDEAMNNLEKINHKVDYIITHCAPTQIVKHIRPDYEVDKLNQFFDVTMQNNEFTRWFFGHYHMDMRIGSKFRCLYDDIIKLDDD